MREFARLVTRRAVSWRIGRQVAPRQTSPCPDLDRGEWHTTEHHSPAGARSATWNRGMPRERAAMLDSAGGCAIVPCALYNAAECPSPNIVGANAMELAELVDWLREEDPRSGNAVAMGRRDAEEVCG